jgi:hypothetical protein
LTFVAVEAVRVQTEGGAEVAAGMGAAGVGEESEMREACLHCREDHQSIRERSSRWLCREHIHSDGAGHRRNTLNKTAFALIAILTFASTAHAASTTRLLAPFVGIWSNTQEGCKKLKQGALDKMDTHHATQFGIVEVTTSGVDWIYTSGGLARCSFAQGKTRTNGKQIIAPVYCDGGAEDDNNSETRMNIVFSTISSTAMHMQYVATDEDFQSDYYTKVRCRY